MYVEADQLDERIRKKPRIPVSTGMWVLLRLRRWACPSCGFSRDHESQPERAVEAYFFTPSVANLANARLSDSSIAGVQLSERAPLLRAQALLSWEQAHAERAREPPRPWKQAPPKLVTSALSPFEPRARDSLFPQARDPHFASPPTLETPPPPLIHTCNFW